MKYVYCKITVNAYEHGRWELRHNGEYWQVYQMKGKTGSWIDNCETLEEALKRVHEEMEGRLPVELTDHARSEETSAVDRDRS